MTVAAIAAVLMAIVVAGCGGSSSEAAGDSNKVEAAKPSEGEPSKAFLKSQSKAAKFGEEASAEEREAASKVLEENLKARESGDWTSQCATLTPKAVKEVAEVAKIQGVNGGGCAKELKARAEPLQQTKSLRENSMKGPIDALTFKGSRGYALYHGIGGTDFAMPMEKVDGEWQVGGLLEE